MPKKPEVVTAEIIERLYSQKAHKWSVQDKAVLLAAIKLQLAEGAKK